MSVAEAQYLHCLVDYAMINATVSELQTMVSSVKTSSSQQIVVDVSSTELYWHNGQKMRLTE